MKKRLINIIFLLFVGLLVGCNTNEIEGEEKKEFIPENRSDYYDDVITIIKTTEDEIDGTQKECFDADSLLFDVDYSIILNSLEDKNNLIERGYTSNDYLSKYDKDFFTNKSLVIACAFTQSSFPKYYISKLIKNNNKLEVFYTTDHQGDITWDMTTYYFIIAISKSDASGIELVECNKQQIVTAD